MAESSYLNTFDDFEEGDHSMSLLNNSPMHSSVPPQGNNQSFNSYGQETSFDSEGFGQKVAGQNCSFRVVFFDIIMCA